MWAFRRGPTRTLNGVATHPPVPPPGALFLLNSVSLSFLSALKNLPVPSFVALLLTGFKFLLVPISEKKLACTILAFAGPFFVCDVFRVLSSTVQEDSPHPRWRKALNVLDLLPKGSILRVSSPAEAGPYNPALRLFFRSGRGEFSTFLNAHTLLVVPHLTAFYGILSPTRTGLSGRLASGLTPFTFWTTTLCMAREHPPLFRQRLGVSNTTKTISCAPCHPLAKLALLCISSHISHSGANQDYCFGPRDFHQTIPTTRNHPRIWAFSTLQDTSFGCPIRKCSHSSSFSATFLPLAPICLMSDSHTHALLPWNTFRLPYPDLSSVLFVDWTSDESQDTNSIWRLGICSAGSFPLLTEAWHLPAARESGWLFLVGNFSNAIASIPALTDGVVLAW